MNTKQMIDELDKKLEKRFNRCVELCLQQIRGEITEEDRITMMAIQNSRAMKDIKALLS